MPEPWPAVSPTLGRDSAAAARPWRLRSSATAADAACRADGGDRAGWALRAATVAGVRHRLAGDGPEDAYAWRLVDTRPTGTGTETGDGDGQAGPTLVVAVADGVGSVPGAAAAAAAASAAACQAATAGVGDGSFATPAWWAAVCERAATAVEHAGGATTLVVACVADDGTAQLARIGDSAALVLAGGRWEEIWPPESGAGDPLSTQTAALPAERQPELATVTVDTGAALVVMTDGVVAPLRDGPTTVGPSLSAGLAEPPTPIGLALLADFGRQGCLDDRTLVGVWRLTGRY